jgi:hypothetical protein
MKTIKRAFCLGAALAALSGLARADTVDFNTAGDLSTKFNLNFQNGTDGFAQVTSGGIGNSGAVDVTANNPPDVTAVYNVKSYNMADGPIRLQEYVKILPQYATGNRLLQLGMLDDTSLGRQLNGGAPATADYISARVFPTVNPVAGGTTGAFTWQVQSGQATGAGNTATTNLTQSPDFNLILGDWYLLTVDITRTATANTFSVGGSIQDFGIDGLTPGATNTFAPANISGNTTDIYNDTTAFGGFRGHAGTGGADLYDNFSINQTVVPEPAALLGLAGFATLSLIRRRRA